VTKQAAVELVAFDSFNIVLEGTETAKVVIFVELKTFEGSVKHVYFSKNTKVINASNICNSTYPCFTLAT